MQSRETQQRQKNNKNVAANQQNNTKTLPKVKNVIGESEAIKILEEVERLLDNNENLEGINLLTALKDNMGSVKNPNLHILTVLNLGILYYQVGFLEQANDEFSLALQKLKQASQKILSNRNKDMLRIKYETIMGKVELQICILYSQMGKHDVALEHAKNSSRINFNLVYDIITKLYSNLNKLLYSKNYQKKDGFIEHQQAKIILNNIAILNHLLNGTKDLKLAFLQKEKMSILQEQLQITKKYGIIQNKFDTELLYNHEPQEQHLWIYKNKILDQIQLSPFNHEHFQVLAQQMTANQIIEKISFLAISLYCFSTETRFIQKQKNCDSSHDVLDSEHWLSRSLEIAYSFMPAEAPILNQILTVHDRFHGLDKQTIPQDEEVSGFFKVLKPLSKPKSTYSAKNPGCSPIMIRIQADKVDLQLDEPSKTQRDMAMNRNNLEFDDQDKNSDIDLTVKNNKIRGYSHGHKRIQTFDSNKNRFLSSRATIDNPMYVHGNIRGNFVNKKFKKRQDKLKVNFSELNGKALISEDLLSKPQSPNNKMYEQHNRSATQRKKKSFSLRKHEQTKKLNNTNFIKIGGLQLKGHRLQQCIQSELQYKINNERDVIETTRMGGNVYINNNINLFISKPQDSFGQTFIRGQVIHDNKIDKNKDQRQKDMSRRQIFLNKRRANFNINGQEI